MIKSPYLIQRARINRPIADKNTRLSKAASMEYMGSAEFEFGALPESFRRIEEKSANWICRIVPSITEDDTPLRVWSAFTDEEFEKYVGYLQAFREGKGPHTKEGVHFEATRKKTQFSTDFWWDLSNDAMFGFHEEFMKQVGDYVASSLIYMNSAK
jgi:hypothetical protein